MLSFAKSIHRIGPAARHTVADQFVWSQGEKSIWRIEQNGIGQKHHLTNNFNFISQLINNKHRGGRRTDETIFQPAQGLQQPVVAAQNNGPYSHTLYLSKSVFLCPIHLGLQSWEAISMWCYLFCILNAFAYLWCRLFSLEICPCTHFVRRESLHANIPISILIFVSCNVKRSSYSWCRRNNSWPTAQRHTYGSTQRYKSKRIHYFDIISRLLAWCSAGMISLRF